MRLTILVSLLVLALAVGAAAVPQTMSYQGLLRDAVGDPVPDGVYNLTFRLWTQDIGGGVLWVETQSVTTDEGVFNVILGSVNPFLLEFDAPYWLSVAVDGDPDLVPRTELTSSPYAHRAASIDPNVVSSVDGVVNDEGNIDLVAGANITITPNDPANTITIAATGGGDDGDWTISGSDVYRASGNVGIGTSTPIHRLSVHSPGVASANLHFTNGNTGSTITDGLLVGINSSGGPYVWDWEGSGGLTLGSGGTGTMIVYPSSMTLNGSATVHGNAFVYGSMHVDAFDMDTGAANGYVLTADASGNGTWQAPAAVPDDDWTISGNNIYKETGRVSIGTTSAPTDLYVDGTILTSYTGSYAVGSGNYEGLWWNSGTGSVALGDDGHSLELYAGSTAPRVTVDDVTGNMGVGVTVPAARVDVENPAGGAVVGECTHTTTVDYVGVAGYSTPVDFYGVGGSFQGGWRAVEAYVSPGAGATYTAGSFNVNGGTGTNYGVYSYVNGFGSNYAIYGYDATGTDYAGYFVGNVHASGTLTAGTKAFKIDHPLDPENKVLMHSCVESPDMKNIYDGVAVLDASGAAWVEMPEWFEALNMEFRYQLTCVGGYAPVYVAEEIRGNRFQIAGGTPGLKVSWQVTGVRHDAYAEANRLPVEEMKPAEERGLYIHPTAFGRSEEMSLEYQRHQEIEEKEAERGR
jgi:hypothetical protein